MNAHVGGAMYAHVEVRGQPQVLSSGAIYLSLSDNLSMEFAAH